MKKKLEDRWVDNKTLLSLMLEVKDLLLEKLESEEPLDIEGMAKYLKMKKQTVYNKIHTGELPVFKKGGKNYSYPSLLNKWIKGENYYNLDI
ncbi:MAG: helix-turn-helix domain-containing protein [Bacteroidetes bacterium]|nr:helix-turn-helix domain-containing protein [Bacteroidota bacterium]